MGPRIHYGAHRVRITPQEGTLRVLGKFSGEGTGYMAILEYEVQRP